MTKPHATCAALVDNNVRCEKAKQCTRTVNWPNDPRAAFNLCMPHGNGTFKLFAPSSPPLAPAIFTKPQLDLFA